jgi:5-methylcytosine-specific restriction protein A
MQNISSVLQSMGLPWLSGHVPAGNIGQTNMPSLRKMIEAALAARAQKRLETAEPAVIEPAPEVPPAPAPVPAPAIGSAKPEATTTTVVGYVRDRNVVNWVLRRARGLCECCTEPAPFVLADGTPYLEVHHVKHLADKGSDLVTNAVAVCPNCHRRLHHSADAAEARERLYAQVSELVRE